jgi:cell division septation protein DedD
MRLTACLGILFFVLLAPGAMAADNCQAPPGTSGIDEYCEALPTPGGSGSHHGGGGNGGGQKKDRVPAGTRKALQKQGDNGAAVLALTQNAPTAPTGTTQSSTPAPTTTTHHTQTKHHSQAAGGSSQTSGSATAAQSTPRTNATPAPAAPASNPASAVGDSFGGSLGAGFLALLAGIAVVMALVAWLGRRRGPGSAQA